jgi:hypothetical protein
VILLDRGGEAGEHRSLLAERTESVERPTDAFRWSSDVYAAAVRRSSTKPATRRVSSVAVIVTASRGSYRLDRC